MMMALVLSLLFMYFDGEGLDCSIEMIALAVKMLDCWLIVVMEWLAGLISCIVVLMQNVIHHSCIHLCFICRLQCFLYPFHFQRHPTIHQLTAPFILSNPPLKWSSGFTTFPCNSVYLTIFSQCSGLTLASQIHCAASIEPPSRFCLFSSSPFALLPFAWVVATASARRYISKFALNLWPPTWLMKYIPQAPGRWS